MNETYWETSQNGKSREADKKSHNDNNSNLFFHMLFLQTGVISPLQSKETKVRQTSECAHTLNQQDSLKRWFFIFAVNMSQWNCHGLVVQCVIYMDLNTEAPCSYWSRCKNWVNFVYMFILHGNSSWKETLLISLVSTGCVCVPSVLVLLLNFIRRTAGLQLLSMVFTLMKGRKSL